MNNNSSSQRHYSLRNKRKLESITATKDIENEKNGYDNNSKKNDCNNDNHYSLNVISNSSSNSSRNNSSDTSEVSSSDSESYILPINITTTQRNLKIPTANSNKITTTHSHSSVPLLPKSPQLDAITLSPSTSSSSATDIPTPIKNINTINTTLPSTTSTDYQSSSKKQKLTPQERKELVHHRILRNRVAAQESRDKKKKQMERLQETNEKLLSENQELKTRMGILEAQNALLQTQMTLILNGLTASSSGLMDIQPNPSSFTASLEQRRNHHNLVVPEKNEASSLSSFDDTSLLLSLPFVLPSSTNNSNIINVNTSSINNKDNGNNNFDIDCVFGSLVNTETPLSPSTSVPHTEDNHVPCRNADPAVVAVLKSQQRILHLNCISISATIMDNKFLNFQTPQTCLVFSNLKSLNPIQNEKLISRSWMNSLPFNKLKGKASSSEADVSNYFPAVGKNNHSGLRSVAGSSVCAECDRVNRDEVVFSIRRNTTSYPVPLSFVNVVNYDDIVYVDDETVISVNENSIGNKNNSGDQTLTGEVNHPTTINTSTSSYCTINRMPSLNSHGHLSSHGKNHVMFLKERKTNRPLAF